MALNLDGFIRKRKTLKLGGREFCFSELSLADLARFQSWYAEKRQKRLLQQAKALGIPAERLAEQLNRPASESEMLDEMASFEGLGYLAYLSLKYAHPEVTLDEAMQIVTIDNLEEISKIILGSFYPGQDSEKKKQTKRSTGQRL